MDRQLHKAVGDLDIDAPGLADLSREIRQQIATNEAAFERVTVPGEEISTPGVTAACAQIESGAGHRHSLPDKRGGELQRLGIYCDRCFVLYDAIVETTEDEALLHTAQGLAATALDRANFFNQFM